MRLIIVRLAKLLYLILSEDSRLITLQKMLEEKPYSIVEAAIVSEVEDNHSSLVSLVYLVIKLI